MPSFALLRSTSARRRLRMPLVVATVAAAAFVAAAGPARADVLPTLTSFSVSPATVDVTTGEGHITVLMSVSDPDATTAGTGDVLARKPTRGYQAFGPLVQIGGTARNPQYRADITLPAGVALNYRLSISYLDVDHSSLVDLDSQLAASGWPYHVDAIVTAPPAPPRNLTFHREVLSNKSTVVVSWDPPAAGAPVPTGATLTGSTCGTLKSAHASEALFTDLPKSSLCKVTVSLFNSAGSSPTTTGSARL
jgi:hypothetical protein